MISSLSKAIQRRNAAGWIARCFLGVLDGSQIYPPEAVSIEDKVYEHMRRSCKIEAGHKLLLCVSGGVDSMAMLHMITSIRRRRNIPLTLEVVYFNHKLRKEADEEALFVQSTAEHYGITFHLREWHAKPLQVGMHSATRTWRRRECMKLIGWNEAGWDHAGRKDGDELCARDVVDHSLEPRSFVCTAHQVEDQVETFMLKLLRGAHISRLNMMKARDGLFLKPLLIISKDQLVQYMRLMGHSWREDASNAEKKYQRNRIRQDLCPLMGHLAGGQSALYRRIESLSDQSTELRSWIDGVVREYTRGWGGAKEKRLQLIGGDLHIQFKNLPSMVQGDIVHEFILVNTGLKPDYRTVTRVMALVSRLENHELYDHIKTVPRGDNLINKRLTLSEKWEVLRERNSLLIRERIL